MWKFFLTDIDRKLEVFQTTVMHILCSFQSHTQFLIKIIDKSFNEQSEFLLRQQVLPNKINLILHTIIPLKACLPATYYIAHLSFWYHLTSAHLSNHIQTGHTKR